MCIIGPPQHEYTPKMDVASPTVGIDLMFITSAIDANEEWEVATCNLPGAFLHTITDKKVIMVMRNELCNLFQVGRYHNIGNKWKVIKY